MLNEDLKKEGLKALKLWNGMMIGSLVLVAAGLVLTGAAAIKAKVNEKIEEDIKAKPEDDKLTHDDVMAMMRNEKPFTYDDISSILHREDNDDHEDDE